MINIWRPSGLTHWGLVMHICISEPGQHWFRLWTQHLFGTKPLAESLLTYCQLDQKSVKFGWRFEYFLARKYIWTCCCKTLAILARPWHIKKKFFRPPVVSSVSFHEQPSPLCSLSKLWPKSSLSDLTLARLHCTHSKSWRGQPLVYAHYEKVTHIMLNCLEDTKNMFWIACHFEMAKV